MEARPPRLTPTPTINIPQAHLDQRDQSDQPTGLRYCPVKPRKTGALTAQAPRRVSGTKGPVGGALKLDRFIYQTRSITLDRLLRTKTFRLVSKAARNTVNNRNCHRPTLLLLLFAHKSETDALIWL